MTRVIGMKNEKKRKILGFISICSALIPTIIIFAIILFTGRTYQFFGICGLLYVFQIVALVTGIMGIHNALGKTGLIISILIILGITAWNILIITGLPRT